MVASGETGRALVPFVPRPGRERGLARTAALVALFGVMAGVGGAGTYALRHQLVRLSGSDPAVTAALRATKADVARLSASLDQVRTAAEAARAEDGTRALKRAVDALKAEVEQLRSTSGTTAIQTAARLDRIERDGKAGAGDAGKDRGADLATRVERLERQAAAPLATGSIPARPATEAAAVKLPVAAPAKAPASADAGKGATPVGKATPAPVAVARAAAPPPPAAKVDTTAVPASPPAPPVRAAAAAAPLKGWVVRDVYDGIALVQARGGGLREVEPGEVLPGAGEVRSIERRGRGWVVLTSRGLIDGATF